MDFQHDIIHRTTLPPCNPTNKKALGSKYLSLFGQSEAYS